MYKKQNKMEQWQETLEECLNHPDYGLSHASVCIDLANYFMERRQWEKALPYAESGAQSYSGWGLLTAAACHEAMHHWKEAESLYQAVANSVTLIRPTSGIATANCAAAANWSPPGRRSWNRCPPAPTSRPTCVTTSPWLCTTSWKSNRRRPCRSSLPTSKRTVIRIRACSRRSYTIKVTKQRAKPGVMLQQIKTRGQLPPSRHGKAAAGTGRPGRFAGQGFAARGQGRHRPRGGRPDRQGHGQRREVQFLRLPGQILLTPRKAGQGRGLLEEVHCRRGDERLL